MVVEVLTATTSNISRDLDGGVFPSSLQILAIRDVDLAHIGRPLKFGVKVNYIYLVWELMGGLIDGLQTGEVLRGVFTFLEGWARVILFSEFYVFLLSFILCGLCLLGKDMGLTGSYNRHSAYAFDF